MGASNSCFPRYGCCVPKNQSFSNDQKGSSTPKHQKGHHRNLSAAFNLADMSNEPAMDQMNINSATEEQLMTLPGITRQIANNIVEYRLQIGGFKKIEDLALVSGVGATRLEVLRLEICVGNKKSSINSSLSSSQQELTLQDNASRTSCKSQKSNNLYPRVSLNNSNVFQLMKVKGISQQLAENIVIYRDKRGPFKTIDDLIKVKGVKPLLSAIRPYLFLDEDDEALQSNGKMKPYIPVSSQHSGVSHLYPQSTNLLNVSNTESMGSQETLCSMYGPLGRRSYRVKKKRDAAGHKQPPTIRIASWNLHQCSAEKTENLGVREVVAMTILENSLGIVAVQELEDREALEKLCDELNHPVIPNVKKWEGSRGNWKYVVSEVSGKLLKNAEEYLGFLYDTSQGVDLVSAELIDVVAARKSYLAIFQLKDFDLAVVNVHLRSAGLTEGGDVNPIIDLNQAISAHSNGLKDVVVLGNFNTHPDAEEFNGLRSDGFVSVFHRDQCTDISTRNPEGTENHDNIWLSRRTALYKTGNGEIVRDGLNSPWIPDGWGWGGLASDHCPIWVELYSTNQGAGSATIPSATTDKHRLEEDVKVAFKMSAGGDL